MAAAIPGTAYMFGQLWVELDPLPDEVDGDALVDGPTSGDTVGEGDVAACAATSVPKPIAIPSPPAAANFAI